MGIAVDRAKRATRATRMKERMIEVFERERM